MKNASDSQIFELIIREGNLGAFAELFERYWQQLYAKAYARLENEEDAKDCVQDVFTNVWSKRDTLPLPLSVAGYLHTSVKHRVFTQFRTRVADQKHLISYVQKIGFQEEPESHSFGFEELALLIEQEIDYMPEQMRKIYLLSREQNLSGVEIARELELSHQTVRNQISNALRRIKARVDQYRND